MTTKHFIEKALEGGCKGCGGNKDKYDQYCSPTCWHDVMRKPKPLCLNCDKPCNTQQAKTCSFSCRNKVRYQDKSNHPRWNNDASTKYQKLRNSVWKELKVWRDAILARDKVCVQCGSDEKLQADHIKPFISFPELRFELSNGRLLCFECHKVTDTFGVKAVRGGQ